MMGTELQKNYKNDIFYHEYFTEDKEAAMQKKRALKIAVTVVLTVLCLAAFLLSPVFKIQTVTVEGNGYYATEELVAVLQEVTGKNYFLTLFSNVPFSHLDYLFKARLYNQEQKLISEKTYIKAAEVTCHFPDKISVAVEERTPAFLTKFRGEYLLVDSEGYVLEAFSGEEKPCYPIVEGLDVAEYKTGTSLRLQNPSDKLELAIKICNLMKQSEFLEGYIDIIDITNENSIWLFASPSLSVKFGNDSDLAMKISTLKEIFQAGYNGNSQGMIDFTSGKNPIFKYNDKSSED